MTGEHLHAIDDAHLAAITTCGIFASVASGDTAKAVGVTPKPTRKFNLSFTIISCAKRFELSPTPPSLVLQTSLTWNARPACRRQITAPLAIARQRGGFATPFCDCRDCRNLTNSISRSLAGIVFNPRAAAY